MSLVDAITTSVADELGLDVYRLYPDTRRLIPDTVVWGLASGCIAQFLAGFVDFNGLGKEVRAKLDELIRRWRQKDDFERYIETSAPTEAVAVVVQAAMGCASPANIRSGQQKLEQAMIEFGFDPETARIRSERIAKAIAAQLNDPPDAV
jgi:hypothetical protein